MRILLAAHGLKNPTLSAFFDDWLIGNRFWPFEALARSLKLEALISMPGCCQMGL